MSSIVSEAAQLHLGEGNNPTVYEEPEAIEDSADAKWKSHNLLSLDGGGIRGYWSLLVLKKLMEYIAVVEEEYDDNTYHSFSPEEWPDNVSQVPLTDEEKRQIGAANTAEAKCRAISDTRRYLPCHYFDYICGSSTGALIAIMLGRFRMTVPDCIAEYKNLGGEVFGKPRFFTTLRFGVVNRTKYKAENLKRVFEDFTARRSEQLSEPHGRVAFPSKRGLCKTFVTTLMTESDQKVLATLYLIRSYDHNERTSPNQSRKSTRRATTGASRSNTARSDDFGIGGRERHKRRRNINYENAQKFQIWEVARAATAAPFYFEPLKVETPWSSGYMLFKDGGFNYTNNPTKVGVREIEEAHGTNSIGIVVSVGTARLDERPREGGFLPVLPWLKGMTAQATDPEVIHRDLEEESEAGGFPYYRLNDPGALDIELDEWKPKRSPFNNVSGSTTIQTMEDSFARWAMNHRTISRLQNCAQELVERRRARVSNKAKWERYATCAQFSCRMRGCEREEFFDRNQFRDHLIQDHHLTEREQDDEVTHCRKRWRYQ